METNKGPQAEVQDAEADSVDVMPLAHRQREIHQFRTCSCFPFPIMSSE